jgi:hypothetical protein
MRVTYRKDLTVRMAFPLGILAGLLLALLFMVSMNIKESYQEDKVTAEYSGSLDKVTETITETVRPLPKIIEYDQVKGVREKDLVQLETEQAERMARVKSNEYGYVHFPFSGEDLVQAVGEFLSLHPELDPVPTITFMDYNTHGWTLVFREKPKP